MASWILLIYIVIFANAFASNRRTLGVISGFVLFFWFFFVGAGFFADYGLRFLQTYPALREPTWTNKTVIVVLGGGTTARQPNEPLGTTTSATPRVLEAARLFRLCAMQAKSCRVHATAGMGQGFQTEAEVMRRELVEIGVPEAVISVETKSRNTSQNAEFSAPLLKSGGFDQVVLVTSGYHMKRSLKHFKRFGIEAVAAPADYLNPKFLPPHISYNFVLADLVLHECVGLVIAPYQ